MNNLVTLFKHKPIADKEYDRTYYKETNHVEIRS